MRMTFLWCVGQQGEKPQSQCPWRCPSPRPRGRLKTVLAGRTSRCWWGRCGLILGRWGLGPVSAARVGEYGSSPGAVKPIPVLLIGTTCWNRLGMAGRSFLMVMVGWRWLGGGGVRVQVGLGGVEGGSRETERQNSGCGNAVCSARLTRERCRPPIPILKCTHVASET